MISPESLRRYPYFAGVREESLKQVAMMADEQFIPAGTVLFKEGDPAERLYIIVEGEMDVDYTLGSGETRTVDTVVAGDLTMWSALVQPHKATAVATARRDTRLIAIDGPALRELCEQDHDLGYRLLLCLTRLLAHRLQAARVQLATV
jgi:CRP-like cAMP-binding protein